MQFTSEHAKRANDLRANTMDEHLDVVYALDTEGHLTASMPVDHRTKQPLGLLHGGASVALAESLGSMGSALMVDLGTHGVSGVEVNANHLKGVRSGRITATGYLLHRGRTMHVWEIRISSEGGDLCAVCRLTVLVLERR